MLFTLCPHCAPYFIAWNGSKSSLNLRKWLENECGPLRTRLTLWTFNVDSIAVAFDTFSGSWIISDFSRNGQSTLLIWFANSANSRGVLILHFLIKPCDKLDSLQYHRSHPSGLSRGGLVAVPLDGNIWVYMRRAKNITWSKFGGTPIAYNMHSFDSSVGFFQWKGDDTRYNDETLDLSFSSVVIVIGNLPFR